MYYINIVRRTLVILTSILILGATVLVGGFQSQGSPPEITFNIDFPSQISADGERVQSFVFFKDSDKDIAQISFDPSSTVPTGVDAGNVLLMASSF